MRPAETCSTCRHWLSADATCHRHAPSPWVTLTTRAADWCSEWQRRPRHDRDQLIEPLPHDVAKRSHEQ